MFHFNVQPCAYKICQIIVSYVEGLDSENLDNDINGKMRLFLSKSFFSLGTRLYTHPCVSVCVQT